MSLWQKPVGELTFADVDAFLQAKLPEGNRLDYKLKFPTDLAKSIAAFANTLGGMIILGVDGDKVSNEPVWPPVDGMPSDIGIADRIIQLATEAIYPPVRVGVVQFENVHLPGHQIVVIRVDESREAPHAVERKRKVYVYERTDNKNDPHVLADIDRITYLLRRRDQIEDKREKLVEKSFARLGKELESGPNPKVWTAVAPVYPWRDLCSPAACYDFLHGVAQEIGNPHVTGHDIQRIPDGAIMRTKSRFEGGSYMPTDAYLVRSDGLVFCMRTALSLDRRHGWGVGTIDHERVDLLHEATQFWDKIVRLFNVGREFYRRQDVESPGLIALELGLLWVRGIKMLHRGRAGRPYLDDEYRDSAFVTADVFAKPNEGLDSLRRRLMFGFDLEITDGAF